MAFGTAPSHRSLDAKVLLPDEELLHPTVIHSDLCQCGNVIPGYTYATICPPWIKNEATMDIQCPPSQCPWLILALQIYFFVAGPISPDRFPESTARPGEIPPDGKFMVPLRCGESKTMDVGDSHNEIK